MRNQVPGTFLVLSEKPRWAKTIGDLPSFPGVPAWPFSPFFTTKEVVVPFGLLTVIVWLPSAFSVVEISGDLPSTPSLPLAPAAPLSPLSPLTPFSPGRPWSPLSPFAMLRTVPSDKVTMVLPSLSFSVLVTVNGAASFPLVPAAPRSPLSPFAPSGIKILLVVSKVSGFLMRNQVPGTFLVLSEKPRWANTTGDLPSFPGVPASPFSPFFTTNEVVVPLGFLMVMVWLPSGFSEVEISGDLPSTPFLPSFPLVPAAPWAPVSPRSPLSPFSPLSPLAPSLISPVATASLLVSALPVSGFTG